MLELDACTGVGIDGGQDAIGGWRAAVRSETAFASRLAPGATSRLGQQPEPLAGRSVSEPRVGTDEVVSNGPVGRRDESRAELHRVGGPKRVGSDQAHRSLPHGPERGYLRPGGGELSERGAGGGALGIGQAALPRPSLDRRSDLDGRDGPRDDSGAGEPTYR